MNKVTITALEPQKKRPGRRSVFADGTFLFGLDEETCIKAGLRTGNSYTPEELEQVREEAEFSDAKHYGFGLIARRSYSVFLLEKKLTERGYPAQIAKRVSDLLCQLGYLNDEAYAKSYVHDAALLRKKGRKLIYQELCARGIDRETAERALDELKEQHDESEALEQVIRKRLTDPADQKMVRRVFDYCIRRGFDYPSVSRALKRYIEEEEYE